MSTLVDKLPQRSIFTRSSPPACPAAAASVAKDPKRALFTFFYEMRHIKVLFWNWKAEVVLQFKMHGLSLVGHARPECLCVLQLLTINSVLLAFFDEGRSRFHKTKRNIPGYTFFSQCFDPFKITRSAPAVVLSSAGNLLDLPAVAEASRLPSSGFHKSH